MKINLHQSSAGIGKRLNTQRLIEIIAQITTKNIIQPSKEWLMKSTIQMGQLTCSKASVLSFGVSGLNIFLINIHNHLNVNNVWLYVSKLQYLIESIIQYLYSNSLFNFIFS